MASQGVLATGLTPPPPDPALSLWELPGPCNWPDQLRLQLLLPVVVAGGAVKRPVSTAGQGSAVAKCDPWRVSTATFPLSCLVPRPQSCAVTWRHSQVLPSMARVTMGSYGRGAALEGREGPRGGVAAGPGMCWEEGTRPPPSTTRITSNRGPAGDGEGGSRLWSEGSLGDCLPRTVRGSGHRRRPVREGEATGPEPASPLPCPMAWQALGAPLTGTGTGTSSLQMWSEMRGGGPSERQARQRDSSHPEPRHPSARCRVPLPWVSVGPRNHPTQTLNTFVLLRPR